LPSLIKHTAIKISNEWRYSSTFLSISLWFYSPLELSRLFSFLILHTFGRAPWTGDQPVARPLPTHRTTQTQNKSTQTSMSRVRFEPTIPVFERAKTVHALYCAVTVFGPWNLGSWHYFEIYQHTHKLEPPDILVSHDVPWAPKHFYSTLLCLQAPDISTNTRATGQINVSQSSISWDITPCSPLKGR
jgi:hypothetical protein